MPGTKITFTNDKDFLLRSISENIWTCVLAGGLSTRLRPLTKTIPKPMIPIGPKPFLQLLLEHLSSLGLTRFILATGYLHEQIQDYFGDGRSFGFHIEHSLEPKPLGTGGAVLWAQPIWGESVIIVNGDTFLAEDWTKLLATHRARGQPITMAVARHQDRARFGSVQIRGNRVIGFAEKNTHAGTGWMNAGAYVLERRVFSSFRLGQTFSLELDVFPSFLGQIVAHRCSRPFADIGTPTSLQQFRQKMI